MRTDEFPEAIAFLFFSSYCNETENRIKNGNIFNQWDCIQKGLCECPPRGVLFADMKGDKISAQGTVQFHDI